MEYRVNRRTGDRISIIGLGTSAIPGAGIQEGIDTLRQAFDHGVNYFDLATAESDTFPLFRQALAGDGLAADHYRGLAVHADACVACGHCNRRCPFHVDQVARMGEIARYFAG